MKLTFYLKLGPCSLSLPSRKRLAKQRMFTSRKWDLPRGGWAVAPWAREPGLDWLSGRRVEQAQGS